MLRIGKLTDYALLIASQLAKTPETVLSASTLAECLHLSVPTVSKVLKMLSDARLVNSTRGTDGGYRLARPAMDISVADLLAAMEGELALTECCEKVSGCVIEPTCLLKGNWIKINKMVETMLSHVTLVDMLKPLSTRGT